MTDAEQMTQEPVHIAPYNASWPDLFEEEKALLSKVIGQWVTGTIEHVGSTAIPGMPAKPVIDIMVGVEGLDASRPALAVLKDHGYCYAPYKTDVMHWLSKPSTAHRTHHLHLVPYQSALWQERLNFRDYLRTHPDVAKEYADLKRKLANEHHLDREAYTQAKGPFVDRVRDLTRTKQ